MLCRPPRSLRMSQLPRGVYPISHRSIVGLLVFVFGTAVAFYWNGELPRATLAGETAEAEKAKAGTPGAAAAKDAPVALNKNGTVLLDKVGKRLLLKTHVVLREALLEQFCCL